MEVVSVVGALALAVALAAVGVGLGVMRVGVTALGEEVVLVGVGALEEGGPVEVVE